MTNAERREAGWSPTTELRWGEGMELVWMGLGPVWMPGRVLQQKWVRSSDGAHDWFPIEEAP